MNVLDSPILILKGHAAAVWAIIELGGSQNIATASADKTIIIWNNDGEKIQCLTGKSSFW